MVRIHPPQFTKPCDNTLCDQGLGNSPRPSSLNNHQLITRRVLQVVFLASIGGAAISPWNSRGKKWLRSTIRQRDRLCRAQSRLNQETVSRISD